MEAKRTLEVLARLIVVRPDLLLQVLPKAALLVLGRRLGLRRRKSENLVWVWTLKSLSEQADVERVGRERGLR